jgi:tetratricopeptide (TPR) repeat protein
VLEQNYEEAIHKFLQARAFAKTDEFRAQALYKLNDIYLQRGQWPEAIGCWDAIVKIEPAGIDARLGKLEYFYILAQQGDHRLWSEVQSQAEDFLKAVTDQTVLAGRVADVSRLQDYYSIPSDSLKGFLYYLRGKTALELAKAGSVAKVDETLETAIKALKELLEVEAGNVAGYQAYAEALVLQGDIAASDGDERKKIIATDKALGILQKCVEENKSDATAAVNMVNMKFHKVTLDNADRQKIGEMAPEFISLTEKFPQSPIVFTALTKYYLQPILGCKSMAKAVEPASKALELDPENVAYSINLAEAYARKFACDEDIKNLEKGLEVAVKALDFPGAQVVEGPKQFANRMNRIYLCSFIANYTVQQIIDPVESLNDDSKAALLEQVAKVVHELEQLYGSGENPLVLKWQGMLAFAEGDKVNAVKKLYAVYEQFNASGKPDPQLSYVLAKAYENSSEQGAVAEFLSSALNSGYVWSKPDLLLEYANVMLKLRRPTNALASIKAYEENFGKNEKTESLTIEAYLAANQYDEAESNLKASSLKPDQEILFEGQFLIAKIRNMTRQLNQRKLTVNQDEVAAEKNEQELSVLQSELDNLWTQLCSVFEKMVESGADFEDSYIGPVCNRYIEDGDVAKALKLVDKILVLNPENATASLMKKILSEPDPSKIDFEKMMAIEIEQVQSVQDELKRALRLGIVYRKYNQVEKAEQEFLKVLNSQGDETDDPSPEAVSASNYLIHGALTANDDKLADQVAELAKKYNLDYCGGLFYSASSSFIRKDFESALESLNQAIVKRPIFSAAYLLRANVHAAMGDFDQALVDAKKTISLNPLDPLYTKSVALIYNQRNQSLGNNINSKQIQETKDAILRSLSLLPDDDNLIKLYSNYLMKDNPDQALAIRQNLQKVRPTVENALQWGLMALELSADNVDSAKKEFLVEMALGAFTEAQKLSPDDPGVLAAFSEYYRQTGQADKAEEMLKASGDSATLWRHYFMAGQLGKAREVLESLYSKNSEDPEIIQGLLHVTRKQADVEAVEKYGTRLVEVNDNVESRLFELESLLMIGLTQQAENRVQSLKEKFPNEQRTVIVEAWLASRKGDLKAALTYVNEALQEDDQNVTAWKLRGEVNLQLTNYQKAISDLAMAKSLVDNAETRISLAKAYLRVQRYEEAITELRTVAIDSESTSQSRLLLERVYQKLDKTAELKDFYFVTFTKFPDSAFWMNRAGNFAISQKDYKTAEKMFGSARNSNETNLNIMTSSIDGYLNSLFLQEKYDLLMTEAAKYVDTDFATTVFLRMAQVKKELGDKVAAVKFCRSAIDKAGVNQGLAANAIDAMYAMVGKEEVSAYCAEKISKNPESLVANVTMYNLAKIDARYNKAIEYIDKCIEIVSKQNANGALNFRLQKAMLFQMAYIKTSDKSYLERCIKEYESVLEKMPNSMVVLNNLAYVMANNGLDMDKALSYAQKVYELAPNNPSFLDTYAL